MQWRFLFFDFRQYFPEKSWYIINCLSKQAQDDARSRRIDMPNYFLRPHAGWADPQRGLCGKHVLAKREVFSGVAGCFTGLMCSRWIVLIIPNYIWDFIKNRRHSKHISWANCADSLPTGRFWRQIIHGVFARWMDCQIYMLHATLSHQPENRSCSKTCPYAPGVIKTHRA